MSASLHWMRKGMGGLLLTSFAAGLPLSGRLAHAMVFSFAAITASVASVAAVKALEARTRPAARTAIGLLTAALCVTLVELVAAIAFPALRMEMGSLLPLAALAPFACLVPPREGRRPAMPAALLEAFSASGLSALALCLLAAVRELLSTGTVSFSGGDPVVRLSFSLGFVALGAGALIASGYLLAVANAPKGKEASE